MKWLRLLILISVLCAVIVVNGFSAHRWQKPGWRSIYEDYNVDSPAGTKDCPKSGSHHGSPGWPSEYSAGVSYQTTCSDISPEAGTIIEHDEIGSTWYEYQSNGSIGRMISVTDLGYRHFSWTWAGGIYPPGPRAVKARAKNLAGAFCDPFEVGPGAANAGYSRQTHLHDGTSVIVFHQTAPTPDEWWCAVGIEDSSGACSYNRIWDLPDAMPEGASGEEGAWPRTAALYDPDDDRDYVHVVMIEGATGCGGPYVLGYLRTYLGTGDTLICQCYHSGALTYKLPANSSTPDTCVTGQFGLSCDLAQTIATGRGMVGRKVAMAYLPPAGAKSCDYLADVAYVECNDNGDGWVDGNDWPPTIHNITNFGTTGYERGFHDISLCYDYQDSLHITYVTCGFLPENPGFYQPGVARLYHWSKKTGTVLIASKIQPGAYPPAHNLNIGKMSISALDPVHYPKDDWAYLYCTWTQFDSSDVSPHEDGNGDLFGCGSSDGGQTWGQPWNLTNTQTPGCAPGECLNEHWSSMAQNMYDGDLHIQYICDRDAGGAIMDEGAWTENPVMYLRLSPWDVTLAPRGLYIIVPPNWCQPPLKVVRGGTRELLLTVRNIGNMELSYNASGDHDCILGSHSGTITPGDSVTLTFSIQGTGVCDDTLIDGNIVLTTNEGGMHIDEFPVVAVVADDYYECPKDAETVDTLDNGILRLYTNANCMEWIHDVGTFPDTTHEVFFTGGTMVATTSDGDTLVGRYMGQNDQHAGARDKLYREECDVDWEPDFSILYTKNIFMHDLEPPADYKWYWWEMSKQVKFFKETAPDVYRHLVIKYVTVKRHDPPTWWPDHDPFTGYDDTYIGVVEDMDCPADTFEFLHACNSAGYDDVNDIAWQKGWDYTGAHPEYNDYHCGVALADAGMPGESAVPYGSYNIRNDVYLYPQGGWGWKDGELYQLASTSGNTIQDLDAIVDRSWVFTAQKIDAGSDPGREARFTVILAVAPGGLSQLQEYIDTARAVVVREKTDGGLPAQCGDCNGDFVVNVGDIVSLVGYLFKAQSPPKCPINRGDCTSDGIINVADIVYLVGYLYRGGPAPVCPGIWY
ncbi:MAG: dockerin type I repeat-containing protein [Candidatus Zixiibacteriota bacterium]|nr:MAG: dockerin type I repeat-containing protein [candidate division Zixibacteria bacterium]